jgi:hypothetical protein
MAELEVTHKDGPVIGGPDMGLVVASTVIKKGDALFHNGTAWALADGSDKTKPAQGFALNDVDSAQDLAQRVNVSRHVYVNDPDAPFTAGDAEWLSETAGAITHTRPTTIGSLRQPLGQALTTKITERIIRPNSYVNVPIIITKEGSSAAAILDSGNFASAGTLDAANETVYMAAFLPDNFLAVEYAGIWVASEAAVAAITFELEMSGALSDEAWDANTVETSQNDVAMEGSAADDVFLSNITPSFVTTEGLAMSKPGSILGMKFNRDDAGTDISMTFGGYIVCKVAA